MDQDFLTYRKGDNVTLHVDLHQVCAAGPEVKVPQPGTLGVVCDVGAVGTMLVKFKGRRSPMIVRRAFLRKEKITVLRLPKWA